MKALMCQPDHFDLEYQINPWMNPKQIINHQKANNQWTQLKKTIENFLGKNVAVIKQRQGLPDMVFTADQAVVVGKKALLARFKYHQRKQESHFCKKWLINNDFEVKTLPKKNYLEGGDILFWRNKILAGYGFRTSYDSHQILEKVFNKQVVSLKLTNPYAYHLDIALFPTEEMIFYYPPAFDQKSLDQLKKLAQTKPISLEQVMSFDMNNIRVGKKIIASKTANGSLNCLKSLGYQIKKVDLSEFQKSGGGAHCLACFFN